MTTSKLEATTAYSALELLKRDLKRLSWLMRAVSIELPQLSRSADAVLKSGSELRFDENQIEIVRNNELPKQSPEAGFQEDFLNESYASLQRFLKDAFELQCSLEKTFANLPEEITSKLPAKDGSPWRAYYVRECLDLIRLWPKDVYVAVPYLEPEINIYDLCSITSPTRRGPSFALHERFKRFELLLNDAVDDISSLRFDFSPKVPKSDGCANAFVC